MKTLFTSAYFGPIEYYAAMIQSEAPLIEQFDNFQKQTYRTRCYIYGANGRLALNIPVTHTKEKDGHQLTSQITPSFDSPWQAEHWKSIQTAYRTSPYFEYFEDHFAPLYSKRPRTLFEFNREAHQIVCRCLGIELDPPLTESYDPAPSDMIDLREHFQAKKQSPTSMPPYIQVFGDKYGFLPNLSILDLLFCEGRNALDYLKKIKPVF